MIPRVAGDWNYSVKTQKMGLGVTTGNLAGYDYIAKFGVNLSITTGSDPEDIWEGGDIYPFSTTADIVSLSSSDAGDSQIIRIQGLTLDGTEVIQDITLNGQTRVALTTPLWRVYRMLNMNSTELAGDVYCYSGTANTGGVPSGGSVEKARISINNNQTLMAIYTVPKGKVAFVMRGEGGIQFAAGFLGGAEFARLSYRARVQGEVFRVIKVVTVSTEGSSNYKDERIFPDPTPSLTDILIRVDEVSATVGIWASFDLLLVDENKFDNDYLVSIGQPGFS